MKSITIAGNIGRDADTRHAGETTVTNFSVAVEDRSERDKKTIWFDCSLWGARGEKLAQYLTKGSKIVVTGDLSTRVHEGKTYLQVRADNVTLMGGGERREERSDDVPMPPGLEHTVPRNRGSSFDGSFDDEIPF